MENENEKKPVFYYASIDENSFISYIWHSEQESPGMTQIEDADSIAMLFGTDGETPVRVISEGGVPLFRWDAEAAKAIERPIEEVVEDEKKVFHSVRISHGCMIDTGGHYIDLVQVEVAENALGETQLTARECTVPPDTQIVEVYPPEMRYHAGINGFIKPFWDGSAWAEEATAEEIAAWELEHPAPEIPTSVPDLADRVDALETEKADKTEVQAVWESMAVAYNEGVQTA